MSVDAAVDELLQRWEQLRRQGQSPTAEELCGERTELLEDVRRQLRALAAMDHALDLDHCDPTVSMQDGDFASGVTSAAVEARYSPLRLHARGGIGEVFLARDEELHRDVALKRIQPSHAHYGPSRRRFLYEAEITGRLEHPGVVPVYGLGTDAAGQIVYAMRFIRGETVEQAIDRFHGRRQHDKVTSRQGEVDPAVALSFDSLLFRQLLQRFIAVCNTIGFAHSRGLLHRDLKPANIMLGDYGETLVMDWGMAKEIDKGKWIQGDKENENATLPVSLSSPDLTHPGGVVGTPAYMSPEQASGDAMLGPASDIHGLGATFYALITAQSPFQGDSIPGVVQRASRGEFSPPRQVIPEIPRPLEAICLKAMAHRPEDRYSTALELAADVDRWLAGEPVSAWPEPWPLRARRWMKRHRTWVLSGVAALLVALLSLAVATLLLTAANEREQKAKDLALKQRDRAQKNFRLAREAVEQMLSEVGASQLADVPGMEPVRHALLEKALRFNQQFLEDQNDDPEVRREAGLAYFRAGDIYQKLDRHQDAEAGFRKAMELSAALSSKFPDEAGHRYEHLRAQHRLGWMYSQLGRSSEADVLLAEAHAAGEKLVHEQPQAVSFADYLASICIDLGGLCHTQGRFDKAEALFKQARDVAGDLRKRAPAELAYRLRYATATTNLAVVYNDTDRLALAEESFRTTALDLQALVAERPKVAAYRVNLAMCWSNLAMVYDRLERREDCTSAIQKAIEVSETLVRDHPAVPRYQHDLNDYHMNAASDHLGAKRPAAALASVRKALDRALILARDYPDVTDFRVTIANAHSLLGTVHEEMEQPHEARTAFLEAVKRFEALVQAHSGHADYQSNLADVLADLGNLSRKEKNAAEARTWHEKSLEVRRRLMTQHAGVPRFYLAVAASERSLSRPVDAAATLEKCRSLRLDSPIHLFEVARGFAECIPLVGAGKSSLDAGERAARGRYADKAMQALQLAVKAGYKDAHKLEREPAFEPLRTRADFEALLPSLKSHSP